MLRVTGLSVSYGSVNAVKKVSFEVAKGEIVAIIGSNGAGKTTILETISGILKPSEGKIEYQEKDITGQKAEKIVRLGISHMPEGRKIFPDLTVEDNLLLGGWVRRRDRQIIQQNIDIVFSYFPRLKERKAQLAGTLSGGEQQMLAISRALMSSPNVLLLDEPSLGLAPIMVQEIYRIIKELNSQGLTILLVEQMAYLALKVASRGYVLENGRIVLNGTGTELLQNPKVIDAYLGGKKKNQKEKPKEASL
ncbi:MAG: ABC transporter ATP-binding protein [Bacillota bacterium]